jgi:hypothetical protein
VSKLQPGVAFQNFVAMIERAVAPSSDYMVESPKRLRDRDTGRLREHDVVMTCKSGRHQFVVALECRDKGRKVGVPEVEAFRAKCDRTGVDRGIIVSSAGFADSALTKANANGIGCLSLSQASKFNWLLLSHIQQRTRVPVGQPDFHISLGVRPGSPVIGSPEGISFLTETGDEWGPEDRRAVANQLLLSIPLDLSETPGQVYEKVFVDDDPGLVGVLPDGSQLPVTKFTARLRYEITEVQIPIQFHSYRSHEGADVMLEVASAAVSVGDISGSLVMVRQPDETTKVSWIAGTAPEVSPRLA